MKETLRDLAAVWGPPGREAGVARVLGALLEPVVGPSGGRVWTDALGNLLATLPPATESRAATPARGAETSHPVGLVPAPPRRILLCAHMDQAGLVVTEVTKSGLLKFSVAGSLEAAALVGQWVVNESGTRGLVGPEEDVGSTELTAAKLVIDIGARNREAAAERTSVGDVFCPVPRFEDLGDRVSAPALDNRAGCAVLVEVARRLAGLRGARPHTLHFLFSVQGALGPRGARPAAFGLEPDLGLVVDVTPARAGGKSGTEVELGRGPALRIRDGAYVAPPGVREILASAAAAAGVDWQFDILAGPVDTTDAAGIEITGVGVPTGVLCLPARYARTSSPLVSLADVEGTTTLLTALLERPVSLKRQP